MAVDNALYTILTEKIKQGTLVLPTLPEVAIKVRHAADLPDVTLAKMSEVISLDPALSLGILKVANSAMLGGRVKVETVPQAVTRIGLRQIKTVATSMAIAQVFVSKNDLVTSYMQKAWLKTVDIASVAISLMRLYLKAHKHSPFSIDTITLAALVHNIGVLPILTEAENHPEVFAKSEFLQKAISKLSGKIGGEVIRSWGFSDEFTLLTERWSDLSLLPTEVHYLDFIRAGAVHHNIFKSDETKNILLGSYTSKGILPVQDYMVCEEFKTNCKSIKSMFI